MRIIIWLSSIQCLKLLIKFSPFHTHGEYLRFCPWRSSGSSFHKNSNKCFEGISHSCTIRAHWICGCRVACVANAWPSISSARKWIRLTFFFSLREKKRSLDEANRTYKFIWLRAICIIGMPFQNTPFDRTVVGRAWKMKKYVLWDVYVYYIYSTESSFSFLFCVWYFLKNQSFNHHRQPTNLWILASAFVLHIFLPFFPFFS